MLKIFSIEGTEKNPEFTVIYDENKDTTLCLMKGKMSKQTSCEEIKNWLDKYSENPKGKTIFMIFLDNVIGTIRVNMIYILGIVNTIKNVKIIWVYEETADDEDTLEYIDYISKGAGVNVIIKKLSIIRKVEELTDEKMQQFIDEV